MIQGAKLLITDAEGKYLILTRNNHPKFGNDPDLPGGTLEVYELPLEAMLREVQEEIGVTIDKSNIQKAHAWTDYTTHTTHCSLFTITVSVRPEIVLSWEHSSYEWVDRDNFLKRAKNAKDTYMQVVYDVLK